MASRCASTTLAGDDRWGGLLDRCDLQDGHPGPHVSAQGACQPLAWRSWFGSYVEPPHEFIATARSRSKEPYCAVCGIYAEYHDPQPNASPTSTAHNDDATRPNAAPVDGTDGYAERSTREVRDL